jgi:hypothetical protein
MSSESIFLTNHGHKSIVLNQLFKPIMAAFSKNFQSGPIMKTALFFEKTKASRGR